MLTTGQPFATAWLHAVGAPSQTNVGPSPAAPPARRPGARRRPGPARAARARGGERHVALGAAVRDEVAPRADRVAASATRDHAGLLRGEQGRGRGGRSRAARGPARGSAAARLREADGEAGAAEESPVRGIRGLERVVARARGGPRGAVPRRRAAAAGGRARGGARAGGGVVRGRQGF